VTNRQIGLGEEEYESPPRLMQPVFNEGIEQNGPMEVGSQVDMPTLEVLDVPNDDLYPKTAERSIRIPRFNN